MKLEGVLPVLKPQGMTSHDVVATARRLLGLRRIGHTGTLDPQVKGVLPLCLGRATRIAEYIQDLPKTYLATLHVGVATDTEDLSGTVVSRAGNVRLTEERVRHALCKFLGEIEQIPPMYSAVKVQGKKLYELARQGIVVERKPRKVTIYELEIEKMNLDLPVPEITFTVRCSKGTYIRTLCVDIGRALGYPAAMGELVRTSTGLISLDQCLELRQIEEAAANQTLDRYIIPTDRAVGHFPACIVPGRYAEAALNGRKVPVGANETLSAEENQLVRLYSDDGRFLGIFRLQRQGTSAFAAPVKVFH